jgi:OmpA-OmpF porin, OOP family
MRTFLFSVCAGSLLVGAAMAQTTSQPAAPPAEAATPAPVQCVGAEGVVYFDLGSTALNAESEASLRDVANARRDGCTSQITLTGHTDATGSVARNRQLAQRRAEVVKRQLVSLGVPQEEIAIAAAAESAPQSESDDRLNRRVTVVLAASPTAPPAEPAT